MAGYEKYLVSREPRDIILNVENEQLNLKVRDIPRARKNQIISQSVRYDTEGNTHFDGDFYLRECLKYMVVDAPWGQTTDVFLLQLKDVQDGNSNPLADALEALVPVAFKKKDAGLDKVTDIKKE
ncbi:MAG: hypothetical protein Q8Q42_03360 [Nanoarchaeota archaeon]|nr:hypothetical protein [Nanoarchaeota archaeon]